MVTLLRVVEVHSYNIRTQLTWSLTASLVYASSVAISVTQLGPETHIALPINLVLQPFHHLSKWQCHPQGLRLFDSVILP